jgi:hypothetical protein
MSVSCQYCQVDVSVSGRSHVQRSPTEYGVSECDRHAPITGGGALAHSGLLRHWKKKYCLQLQSKWIPWWRTQQDRPRSWCTCTRPHGVTVLLTINVVILIPLVPHIHIKLSHEAVRYFACNRGDKGPQPLLWADSQAAAAVKITVRGTPNGLNYCVSFV